MSTTKKVMSARGEMVDFEWLKIKQDLSTTPTEVRREPRKTKRRRLSDRVSKVVVAAAAAVEAIEDTVSEDTAAPTKIVRKGKTTP